MEQNHQKNVKIKFENLTRLSSYFDRSSSIRFQQDMARYFEYNFAMPSWEKVRMLTAETFVEEKNSKAPIIIRINHTHLSKNVKASLSLKENKNLKQALYCCSISNIRVSVTFTESKNVAAKSSPNYKNMANSIIKR